MCPFGENHVCMTKTGLGPNYSTQTTIMGNLPATSKKSTQEKRQDKAYFQTAMICTANPGLVTANRSNLKTSNNI